MDTCEKLPHCIINQKETKLIRDELNLPFRYSRAAELDEEIKEPFDNPSNHSTVSLPSLSTTTITTAPTTRNNHSPSGSLSNSGPPPDINNNSNNNKEPKDLRIFVEKTFQLSPTLNVLGDFTPKITTVFGWLGIKDILCSFLAF